MSRIFDGSSDVIEVIIRDGSGRKIESRIANLADKEEVGKMFKILKTKYNLRMKEEIDWLGTDSEFLKF